LIQSLKDSGSKNLSTGICNPKNCF